MPTNPILPPGAHRVNLAPSFAAMRMWVLKKQGHLTETQKLDETMGNQNLFVGLDQKTNLIITHVPGKRNEVTTRQFIAGPWSEKPEISSDGWASYPAAITDMNCDVNIVFTKRNGGRTC